MKRSELEAGEFYLYSTRSDWVYSMWACEKVQVLDAQWWVERSAYAPGSKREPFPFTPAFDGAQPIALPPTIRPALASRAGAGVLVARYRRVFMRREENPEWSFIRYDSARLADIRGPFDSAWAEVWAGEQRAIQREQAQRAEDRRLQGKYKTVEEEFAKHGITARRGGLFIMLDESNTDSLLGLLTSFAMTLPPNINR